MSSKEEDLISTQSNKNLKEGEYVLTNSQIFFLNKYLPKGFKFESKENYPHNPQSFQRKLIKKQKNSFSRNDSLDEIKSHSKNEIQIQKKKKKISDSESSSSSSASISSQEMRLKQKQYLGKKPEKKPEIKVEKNKEKISLPKCLKIIENLRKNPISEYFCKPNQEAGSLIKIEKNLQINAYDSSYTFAMDVRRLFNYYFSNSSPEFYGKTYSLSNEFEKMFKEINDIPVKEEKNEIQKKLVKPIEKSSEKLIQNQIRSEPPIKNENNSSKIEVKTSTQKQVNVHKPISSIQKEKLRNDIGTLNNFELKGIIAILETVGQKTPSGFFEFEIDDLNPQQLNNLIEYVEKCKLKRINSEAVSSSKKTVIENKKTENKNIESKETQDTLKREKIENHKNKEINPLLKKMPGPEKTEKVLEDKNKFLVKHENEPNKNQPTQKKIEESKNKNIIRNNKSDLVENKEIEKIVKNNDNVKNQDIVQRNTTIQHNKNEIHLKTNSSLQSKKTDESSLINKPNKDSSVQNKTNQNIKDEINEIKVKSNLNSFISEKDVNNKDSKNDKVNLKPIKTNTIQDSEDFRKETNPINPIKSSVFSNKETVENKLPTNLSINQSNINNLNLQYSPTNQVFIKPTIEVVNNNPPKIEKKEESEPIVDPKIAEKKIVKPLSSDSDDDSSSDSSLSSIDFSKPNKNVNDRLF